MFDEMTVTERHAQAVWYDERLRPPSLATLSGARVKVLHPGEWNLGAGPDFLNALLSIDGVEVRGDVEVHLEPADWERHGHTGDERYAHVVAHVVWSNTSLPPAGLPPNAVTIPLGASFTSGGAFSIDDIDVTAYPYAQLPATPRPCQQCLHGRSDLVLNLLREAGRRRLFIKVRRFKAELLRRKETALLMDDTAVEEQLLYEQLMAAFGYRYNVAPCRAVAQVLPLVELPAAPEEAVAAMLGVGQILPQRATTLFNDERIRALWDWWFAHQRKQISSEFTWRFAGVRPCNSPVRRLHAAAQFFTAHGAGHLAQAFANCDLHTLLGRRRALGILTDNRIVGERRAAAILFNVITPFLVATGRMKELPDELPSEDFSEPMRLTALRLLGRDHNPALYLANNILMQGLIQIHHDFCLASHPACANCRLISSITTNIQ